MGPFQKATFWGPQKPVCGDYHFTRKKWESKCYSKSFSSQCAWIAVNQVTSYSESMDLLLKNPRINFRDFHRFFPFFHLLKRWQKSTVNHPLKLARTWSPTPPTGSHTNPPSARLNRHLSIGFFTSEKFVAPQKLGLKMFDSTTWVTWKSYRWWILYSFSFLQGSRPLNERKAYTPPERPEPSGRGSLSFGTQQHHFISPTAIWSPTYNLLVLQDHCSGSPESFEKKQVYV